MWIGQQKVKDSKIMKHKPLSTNSVSGICYSTIASVCLLEQFVSLSFVSYMSVIIDGRSVNHRYELVIPP